MSENWNPHQALQLSAAQLDRLRVAIDHSASGQPYAYPWFGLGKEFHGTLRFVGYGSLLNRRDAARTLSEATLAGRHPVVAFGALRTFNYAMPVGSEAHGPPEHSSEMAALNVRLTGSIDDAVNGVLVEVPAAEIDALRRREIDYNLEPVACLDWNALQQPPFLAYLLECTADRITDSLEPHPNYYKVCRGGAAEFGERFLEFYLHTTYLADGVTSLVEWEAMQ